MQKISAFLWFDHEAEEAANFYVSVFSTRVGAPADGGGTKVLNVSRYGDAMPDAAGKVMTASFQLEGQDFTALNGGPGHPFSDAISLFVNCETQEEVDDLWDKLTADGGEPGPCGWLKDKFGLSWQIIPTALGELLGDPDPEKSQRAMKAMLEMSKIDIEGLKRAYASA